MRIVQTFWTAGRFKASNEGGLTKCQSVSLFGEDSALSDGGGGEDKDLPRIAPLLKAKTCSKNRLLSLQF